VSVRRSSPPDAPAVVLIPVLDRPHRARPVVSSIVETSDASVLFVATAGDRDELRAIRSVQRKHDRVGLLLVEPHPHGDYARKINAGVRATSEEWVFQGADDLVFHPGWLDEALLAAEINRARVIGTQDLCNPRTRTGRHSTHSLVARSYVEEIGTVDEPGKLLHEGYAHGFVDDELVYTAKRRGEFAFAPRSIVEHLHPTRKTAAMDATYEKATDRRNHARDRAMFGTRRRIVDPAAARRRTIRGIR
jgi:glycosyltransferase involved in cell wall biosynthesis